jgi:hypothetical protein
MYQCLFGCFADADDGDGESSAGGAGGLALEIVGTGMDYEASADDGVDVFHI